MEESVQKQQAEEAIKVKLQSQLRENEVVIKVHREERDALVKDKENLEDLIK